MMPSTGAEQQCSGGHSSDPTIQLYIQFPSRPEFTLRVPSSVTVEQVKMMAIEHFRTPIKAMSTAHHEPLSNATPPTPIILGVQPPVPGGNEQTLQLHFDPAASSTSASQFSTTSNYGVVPGPSHGAEVGPRQVPPGKHSNYAAANYDPSTRETIGDIWMSVSNEEVNFDSNSGNFTLFHVDEIRQLEDSSSLTHEQIANEANLLLVYEPEFEPQSTTAVGRGSVSDPTIDLARRLRKRGMFVPDELCDGPDVTLQDVMHATRHLPLRPKGDKCFSSADKKFPDNVTLRRTLLGVAHSCLRQLMGSGVDGDRSPQAVEETFNAILAKMEKNRTISMRLETLQKLKDMGFSEAKASMAMQRNSTVEEAADWLLATMPGLYEPPPSTPRTLRSGDDPVQVLMPRFWDYRRRYFLVNAEQHKHLVDAGYDRARAFDALLQTNNDEYNAELLLYEEHTQCKDIIYTPLDKKNTIMENIYASAVLQSSLNNPKVLYAIMTMIDSPTYTNMWLSDSDTEGVIRHILKVFNVELFNRENTEALGAVQQEEHGCVRSDTVESTDE